MWLFLTRAALSAFAMGSSCAIALYTGKAPLKFLKEVKK